MTRESNAYAAASVIQRAQKLHQRQLAEVVVGSRLKEDVETPRQIRERLRSDFKQLEAYEYAQLFGLFIARMLCPQTRRVANHWSTTIDGAVPSGTFGPVMAKNRFVEL